MVSANKVHPFQILAKRGIWFALSAVVILAGFAKMAVNNSQTGSGLTYGIDFTGGAAYVFKITPPLEGTPAHVSKQIRGIIEGVKSKGNAAAEGKIQVFADGEIQIRTATGSDPDEPTSAATADAQQESQEILSALTGAKLGEVELIASDLVGPVIGQYLKRMAFWALLFGCFAITLYIWGRYNIKGIGAGWMLGLCAVVALIHDALVLVSVYAWTNTEVNTSFVAGLLTVIGYSVNDTVIIFDRIRENLTKQETAQRRNLANVTDTVETSLWQTMTRSVVTSGTTLLPLTTLFLFGGVTIHDFAFALLVGIISGAYSSIFLAAPMFVWMYGKRLAKMEAEGRLVTGAGRPRRTRRETPSKPASTTAKPAAEKPAASAPDAADGSESAESGDGKAKSASRSKRKKRRY